MLRVTSPTPVNEPYLDLMVEAELGKRPRGSRVHVPARSAGCRGRDQRRPGRACAARRRRRPPRPRVPAAPAPQVRAAPAAAARRRLRRASRRHAVAHRAAVQARRRHARADAGRDVQREHRRVRGQQHEPAALGRHRHGARCRDREGDGADRSLARRARAGRRLARRIAIASRVPRPAWKAGARAKRVDASAPRCEDRAAPVAPGRDQVRVSREAGTSRGGAAAAEATVAQNKQLAEANTRIAELEKVVKDLQRATELRNQTMAQAQSQAEAAQGQRPARRRPRADAGARRGRRRPITAPAPVAGAQGRRDADGQGAEPPSRRPSPSRRRSRSRRRNRRRPSR